MALYLTYNFLIYVGIKLINKKVIIGIMQNFLNTEEEEEEENEKGNEIPNKRLGNSSSFPKRGPFALYPKGGGGIQ